jgi:hypothetical protein
VKCSGPPQRKTPLGRGTSQLKRTGDIGRKPAAPKVVDWDAVNAKRAQAAERKAARLAANPKPATKAKPADRIPTAMRAQVLGRAREAGWVCECCGRPLPPSGVHLHHRLRRSQGGLHVAENLMAVRPLCHVTASTSIHQRIKWAQARGFLLKQGTDPATEPVRLHSARWVLLRANGYELAAA